MWPIFLLTALGVVWFQDLRLMMALRDADPVLYRRYGGDSFFPNPVSRFLLMTTILSGSYRTKFSDPTTRAIASQYRACLFGLGLLLFLLPMWVWD
jgi:hypothetical protein